jgi:gluconokinase
MSPAAVFDDVERDLTSADRPLDETADRKVRFVEHEALTRVDRQRCVGGKRARRYVIGKVYSARSIARPARHLTRPHMVPPLSDRDLANEGDHANLDEWRHRAARPDIQSMLNSERGRPLLVAVMGVAGAGKTLIGRTLAARLTLEYADGDDFHPALNVAKMARGEPLTDADRAPWLIAVSVWLAERRTCGAVASCSALRRSYRDTLRSAVPELTFLHLAGSPELIRERVSARTDHFMPASLVSSQFVALEPLASDERGVTIDARSTPAQIVDEFLARV